MIRLLPFILIPILVLAGLGYWRYTASKPNLTTPTPPQAGPIEVPKTLPQASLEELTAKLVREVNDLKSKSSPTPSLVSGSSDLEAQVTELKVRVSALEKATPAPASATNTNTSSTVYIPLGSGGGPWANTDWYSTPEYEISLDPANYPGYKNMVLEVTFRIVEAAGTGSVRLYNVTDSQAASGQLDTTASSFSLKSSSSFTLTTGTKTYKLQVKSSQNKDLFIQSARIKVNF